MKRGFWAVVANLSMLALALASCGTPKLGTENSPIVMTFVPSGDTKAIIASGTEIAAAISAATDLVVTASPAADMAAVRDAICSNKAQIAWLDTFSYVLARDRCGIEAVMVTERLGLTGYRGQINVRADSGITTLQDLKGRVICWVDPTSRSGYVLPRVMLKANGIDPDKDFAKAVEAASYNNVITLVYNGDCDAGATYADARSTMEQDYPDVKEKVAVLGTTAEIPNDSISFAKDFPVDMRDEIIAALLAYAATDAGRQALSNLYGVSGLQLIDDTAYNAFRDELNSAGMNIGDLVK